MKEGLVGIKLHQGSYTNFSGLEKKTPVPESDWGKVAEYCDNDVIATEAAMISIMQQVAQKDIVG